MERVNKCQQDAREAMRVVFFCTYKTYLYAKFSQKTSVSNVNVSNDNFVCLKLAPRRLYVVKLDSTVAKTGTTQIIRRGHIHLQNNHIMCALHIVSHT